MININRITIIKTAGKLLVLLTALLSSNAIACHDQSVAIIKAVCDNNLAKVKQLVKAGADVNATDDNGYNAISNAINQPSDNEPIIKFLASQGADLTKAVQSGIEKGNTSTVKNLLRAYEITADDLELAIAQAEDTLETYKGSTETYKGFIERYKGFITKKEGWIRADRGAKYREKRREYREDISRIRKIIEEHREYISGLKSTVDNINRNLTTAKILLKQMRRAE